jgi:uncharacterized protein YaeQ
MAHPSTLHRFRIDLSDIDRGVYEKIDIRVARHPSESEEFLLTRVLAFTLNFESELAFSKGGLSDPDEPCIALVDPGGGYKLWIEVGNPSTRKLHRATKSSPKVRIYTYKNPELLISELEADGIYQPERLELFCFSTGLLRALEATLTRDNAWNMIHQDGGLMIQVGDDAISGEVLPCSLARLRKT